MTSDTCCGNIMELITGGYSIDSLIIGTVIVPDITHLVCKSCGNRRVYAFGATKIYDTIKLMEEQKINNLPIGDFCDKTQASIMLNVPVKTLNTYKN